MNFRSWLGLLSNLSGIGVLGYQCYLWVWNGYWTAISALSILQYASDLDIHIRCLAGLYKVLDATPLFAWLFFLGAFFFWLGSIRSEG